MQTSITLQTTALFAALLSLSGLPVRAQSSAGNLAGTIYDQAGARLDQAAVILRSADTGAETTAHPNERGEYRFDNVPVGQYSVRASANGLSTVQINQIFVQTGKTSNVNVTLPESRSTPISVVEVSEAPEAPDPVAPPPSVANNTPLAENADPARAVLREIASIRDRLALSADQQIQIRAIFLDRQDQVANIHSDTSLPGPVRREKIKSIRTEAEAKFRDVLNEIQQDEYDQILRERRDRSEKRKQEQLASGPSMSR